MSAIVDFYLNGGKDSKGRTFNDMINMTDDELEESHDVIQYLFPLNEKSNHSADAPVVTDADLLALRTSGIPHFQQALLRFMGFYGMVFNDGKLMPGTSFERSARGWLHQNNHNFKRITRIIRCAVLINLPKAAQKISEGFIALKEHQLGQSNIDETTLKYWTDAVTLPLDQKLNR